MTRGESSSVAIEVSRIALTKTVWPFDGSCALDPTHVLARPERFELPTTWFEARYSIQLSYGRVFKSMT